MIANAPTGRRRRARLKWLLLASAASLALAGAGAAPAGVGWAPPPAPGQVVGAYFPHRTGVDVAAVAEDSSGRIVVAGTFEVSSPLGGAINPSAVALARFGPDGAHDASFGSDGSVTSFSAGDEAEARAQTVTPVADGGLLVGGSTSRGGFVERFTPNGSVDGTFGSGGITSEPQVPPDEFPHSLAVTALSDGTIVAVYVAPQALVAFGEAGDEAGGLTIVRLTPDGTVYSSANYSAPDWKVGDATAYPAWNAAHVFADGSVLVAGSLAQQFSKPCPCTEHPEIVLRRFLPDGTVDTSFGNGGRVVTEIGSDSYADALATSPDGRFVVAATSGTGSDTAVAAARYLPNGTLDPSFGSGGTTTVSRGAADAVAVAADGSVFLGSTQTSDLVIVKLDAAGAPAAGFGANGRATSTDAGFVHALLPDPDGGVTAAVAPHGPGGDTISLARYTPAGTLDPAFGTPSAAFGLPNQGLLAVAATSRLEVAAAGFVDDDAGQRGLRVVYFQQGQPQKFGPDGEATVFIGTRAEATAVGIDRTARVVAAGDSGVGAAARWLVARFGADGSLDKTFGTSGVFTSPEAGAADRVASLAVLPDSRVLVLVRHGGNDFLVRLTASGSLDGGFGEAGRVALPLSGANGLAVTSHGVAIIAGDGLACTWVDLGGTVIKSSAPAVPGAAAAGVGIQHDGELVVAGTMPSGGLVLTRREPDGTLDPTFGTAGVVTRAGLDASGLVVQRDGRIDVAARPHDSPQIAVARFLYDGSVDGSFGDGGVAETLPGGVASGIAESPYGIVVAGAVPAPYGTDLALSTLEEQPLVGAVGGGRLFHVRPNGSAHLVAGGTQPAWSQAAKLLAFVSPDDGAPAISVRAPRTEPQMLLHSPLPSGAVVVDAAPEWSPDGKLLAVQLLDAHGAPTIGVVAVGQGTVRQLDTGTHPAWVANDQLAYVTPNGLLRITDTATGASRTIGHGWDLRAAPRSGLLAVSGTAVFGGYRQWSVIRQNGTLVRRLPKGVWDVGWAPDGRHLAVFVRDKLAIVDLRGHERFLRVEVGEEARAPTFSPDGRLIAFVNHHSHYLISFVDARSGKPVGRWAPGVGFNRADPTWDRTGVYIPTS